MEKKQLNYDKFDIWIFFYRYGVLYTGELSSPLQETKKKTKKPQPFQPSINKYIMIERVLENQSTVT